jgi:hypothetical protein
MRQGVEVSVLKLKEPKCRIRGASRNFLAAADNLQTNSDQPAMPAEANDSRTAKRKGGCLQGIVGRCRELWKELTGDDPMPRLHLTFTMATVIGAFGVCGILFGILGALLMLGNPPSDTVTWTKVGDVLAKSFWRIFLGYGSAAVIHAVAKLYEQQNPPNRKVSDERKL